MIERFLAMDVESQIAIFSFVAVALPNLLEWIVGLFSPRAAHVIHGAIPSVRDTVARGSDLYREIKAKKAKGGNDAPSP